MVPDHQDQDEDLGQVRVYTHLICFYVGLRKQPVCCETKADERCSKVALFNSSKQPFKSDLRSCFCLQTESRPTDRQLSESLSLQVMAFSEHFAIKRWIENNIIQFIGIDVIVSHELPTSSCAGND